MERTHQEQARCKGLYLGADAMPADSICAMMSFALASSDAVLGEISVSNIEQTTADQAPYRSSRNFTACPQTQSIP